MTPQYLYKALALRWVVEMVKARTSKGRNGMTSLERIELIERWLGEAAGYLEKGDTVQSSEKLYKSAEECIKALAEHFHFKEVKDAEERGRWTVTLLERAVRGLAERLGRAVVDSWNGANYLHVWGFHEAKLDTEAVKIRMPAIESLIETTKKTLLP